MGRGDREGMGVASHRGVAYKRRWSLLEGLANGEGISYQQGVCPVRVP